MWNLTFVALNLSCVCCVKPFTQHPFFVKGWEKAGDQGCRVRSVSGCGTGSCGTAGGCARLSWARAQLWHHGVKGRAGGPWEQTGAGTDGLAVKTAQKRCKWHPRNRAWCWECAAL